MAISPRPFYRLLTTRPKQKTLRANRGEPVAHAGRDRLPVIMISTLTERGGSVTTLDALALGASDYVTEPPNTGSLEQTRSRSPARLTPAPTGR